MPEDTENGVPVIHNAAMPPTGADSTTPSTVMNAVSSQITNSQNGDPTVRPMSADTMKIPDPIIEPATSIVASVNVIARTNS